MCGLFNDGVGFLVNNELDEMWKESIFSLIWCVVLVFAWGDLHISRNSSLGIVGVSDATGRGAYEYKSVVRPLGQP